MPESHFGQVKSIACDFKNAYGHADSGEMLKGEDRSAFGKRTDEIVTAEGLWKKKALTDEIEHAHAA